METALKTQENQNKESAEKTYFRRPAYRVIPNEEEYQIRVVMPGVNREGVKVCLDGRRLDIEGKHLYTPSKDWRGVSKEIDWDDYRLALNLNVDIKEDAISAHVENGILTLRLPKPEESKPKTIEVK